MARCEHGFEPAGLADDVRRSPRSWGGALKAFIGESADAQGNQVPCARCDRAARHRVEGEPRCYFHWFDTPPASTRNEVEARQRARARQEGS